MKTKSSLPSSVISTLRRELEWLCAKAHRKPSRRFVGLESLRDWKGRKLLVNHVNKGICRMHENLPTLKELIEGIEGFGGKGGPKDDIREVNIVHRNITIKPRNLSGHLRKRDILAITDELEKLGFHIEGGFCFANVPDDLSLLASGIRACSAGEMPEVPKA
ncbi:MAG: hypothetical protein M0Q93_13150 [Terrimicrobiaceae bacterium]|jgi:hypothetical protein|nr:hypothetical protein [Terrimicrobiaceae bacterium]